MTTFDNDNFINISGKIAVCPDYNNFTWHEPTIQSKTSTLVTGQIQIDHTIDVQYQICTYGNGATLLFLKEWGLAQLGRQTDGRDNHMTTKIF